MKKLGHRQPVYIFEGIAIRKQIARQRHAHSLTNVGKIAFENACNRLAPILPFMIFVSTCLR